ncbi:DUF397 domain-containing protein [Haloechinothrix sp. YIM 98757]|uniref:DUF397 domain-containing protein n=1 Tax=Haloechinothrix aidingensis TaxID=2752311 RepID=A0A838A4X9_9PSEU|nr:DUF397 domain-containing protein [Haloechinothrix aidingensis]MBA0123998.1 DUF397 domain-containing protein [Haloechinothrix aidingensis]
MVPITGFNCESAFSGLGVRDSKDRDAGYLAVPSPTWRAFLRGVTPSQACATRRGRCASPVLSAHITARQAR